MSERKPLALRLAAFSRFLMNGCIEFTGHLNHNGYGTIGDSNGKKILAHRAAWTVHVGQIPADMLILHRCDNRRCINTAHLFVGTQSDNVRDAASKGRTWPQKYGVPCGDKNWNTKTPDAVVLEMRRAYAAGEGTQAAIGARFGVTPKHASGLISGKKRRHITRIEEFRRDT